jgi:hypothetical protein
MSCNEDSGGVIGEDVGIVGDEPTDINVESVLTGDTVPPVNTDGTGTGPKMVTVLGRRLAAASWVEFVGISSTSSSDDGCITVDGRLDGALEGQLNLT